MDSFPCTSCGLCCQRISAVPELSGYDRGDGTCIHLVDHRCSIYEERPEICRIDHMFEKIYATQFSRPQFYLENLKVCKSLQIEAGLPEDQQVKLTR
ncbi:YkgJ family cysteine cluster protein [Ammoniphilus sp. CFH 90114]|uniref:YkgJ family cysteine cluster protein n=1 Tax=Ammoniphilus sp. CFH 90114 TaxID=2493665 RepID=UPI00100E192A|nr:YkgJ family cysteine cluster protein [Ammoniphilus sp. CFH 90114]RXT02774.1 YkgJ family cysteine cluster protein [Ammoniphilus sp. CFH 90114]